MFLVLKSKHECLSQEHKSDLLRFLFHFHWKDFEFAGPRYQIFFSVIKRAALVKEATSFISRKTWEQDSAVDIIQDSISYTGTRIPICTSVYSTTQ